MIFDIFISKKSVDLLHKLDKELKEMLGVFHNLEGGYKKKLDFIRRFEEEQKKGRAEIRGAKAIIDDTHRLLRTVGLEEKSSKTEDVYSSKALDILKELLERWKTNRKLAGLTYREYSDLSILHETLRNLISTLHEQKIWLKKNLPDPSALTKNFTEFEELVKQEGALIGKEEEFLKTLMRETRQVEEDFKRDFTYSLVGYGSLMNADETITELKDTLKKAGIRGINAEFRSRVTPVWVVGYKRFFNKIAIGRKWETNEDVKANRQAVLNVAPSINNKFNGLAIKLTDDEYAAIRKREKGYGVISLKNVYDYRTGKRLSEICICVKSNPLRVDIPVDRKERIKFYANRIGRFAHGIDPDKLTAYNKMPIPRYVEAVDIGVRKLDALLGTHGMYDNYLNTTFCYYIDRTGGPDGTRKIKDYGEIRLIDYYRLIGKEIERRLQLNVI